MPSKIEHFRQLSERTAREIASSPERWTAFLTTAGRLYKYHSTSSCSSSPRGRRPPPVRIMSYGTTGWAGMSAGAAGVLPCWTIPVTDCGFVMCSMLQIPEHPPIPVPPGSGSWGNNTKSL